MDTVGEPGALAYNASREFLLALYELHFQLIGTYYVGLNIKQWMEIVTRVSTGDMTMGDLYSSSAFSQPTARKLVERLIDLGHFERIPDQSDLRRQQIRVTDLGREAWNWGARQHFGLVKDVLAREAKAMGWDDPSVQLLPEAALPAEAPNFAGDYRVAWIKKNFELTKDLAPGVDSRFYIRTQHALFKQEPLMLTDLYSLGPFSPPTVRKWIDLMVERGYFTISIGGGDQRRRLVKRTESFEKAFDEYGCALLQVGRDHVRREREWFHSHAPHCLVRKQMGALS